MEYMDWWMKHLLWFLWWNGNKKEIKKYHCNSCWFIWWFWHTFDLLCFCFIIWLFLASKPGKDLFRIFLTFSSFHIFQISNSRFLFKKWTNIEFSRGISRAEFRLASNIFIKPKKLSQSRSHRLWFSEHFWYEPSEKVSANTLWFVCLLWWWQQINFWLVAGRNLIARASFSLIGLPQHNSVHTEARIKNKLQHSNFIHHWGLLAVAVNSLIQQEKKNRIKWTYQTKS